jgi:hypothetical protein
MDTSNIKLASGLLSDHEALGVGGDPIYRAAEQIRTLVQKELGDSAAQLFAIPVRNDKTNQLDWYSSEGGNVQSYGELSSLDQERVKGELLKHFSSIDQLIRKLNEDIGTDAARTYASLLESAKSYPDDDQIFVINGKPIITFWGFKKNLHAKAFGLKAETPVKPMIPQESLGGVKPPQKSWWQRFGWWLVLAALLLFGIPSILKSCGSDFPLYKQVIEAPNCPEREVSTNCKEEVKPIVPEPVSKAPEKQVMSPEALKKNDLRVFEGKWVLTTGLQDLQTGKKLVIDLDLGSKGSGTAGTQMVGQSCSGGARVNIDGSQNFNVYQEMLNCTDGVRRQTNTYKCSVRPNQTQADCQFTCTNKVTMQLMQCNGVFEKR